MEKVLTQEQLDVIHHFCTSDKSLIVEALAGAAKTSTIEAALKEYKPKQGEVLSIAFNRRIAEELKSRLPIEVNCCTLNALGHRAWGGFVRKKLSVDANKMYHIFNEIMEGQVNEEEWAEVASNLRNLVSAAKSSGLVPKLSSKAGMATGVLQDTDTNWQILAEVFDIETSDWIVGAAKQALTKSIEEAFAGSIDFNDQLYMSTCWNPVAFTKYPIVVVDEAQDLSTLNHVMLEKCLGPKGKLIAIGDRNQSIYAFRGADVNSMDNLRHRFSMEKLTLSTTFRCSKAVTAHVLERVPNIVCPVWAKPGAVEQRGTAWDIKDIKPQSAVICRNNKPLLALAYKFIKAGKPVIINGGDFGEMLIKLLCKVCKATGKNQATNKARLAGMVPDDILAAISAWEDKEVANALAKNKKYWISAIEDKAGSLRTVVQLCGGRHAGEIMQELEQLFANKIGSVILSSGHKSKGLEWDTVYHLNSSLIPSKFAIAEADLGNNGPLDQELNLHYVISTRAKDRLVYIDLEKEARGDTKAQQAS